MVNNFFVLDEDFNTIVKIFVYFCSIILETLKHNDYAEKIFLALGAVADMHGQHHGSGNNGITCR